jgi:peptidoglycan-associated lipoprotein
MLMKFRLSLLVAILFYAIIACTPKATKYLNKAKVQFNQAEYQFAIENLQQALSLGTPVGEANYLMAESYRRSNRYHESEEFYKKAIDAKVPEEEAYFYYAYALKSNGNYEAAANQFSNYIKVGTNFDFINRAKNELQNIKILSEIVNKKSLYKISNIEDLNTDAAEYSPYVYNKDLYFTTSRGVDKMHSANGTGFTEIYQYIFDGTTHFSGQAKKLSDLINTPDAHESNAILMKDGNTLIFARGNDGSKKGAQDVDIYSSKRQADGTWGEATMLKINNPEAWDASPVLSQDEKTLYFASNREGGNGGVDIYKATKNAEGEWDAPENLGTPINTRGNDMFPYESKEGKFYFSSDGHPSIGALDFFEVKKQGNAVKIENMGSGINTSYDELTLFYTDSINGYFASNRPGGKGDDDIYEFVDESKVRIARYVLDGTVFGEGKDKKQFLLPGSHIIILNEKGDTVQVITADENGQFKADLQPDTKYTVIASKQPGHLTEEIEVFIPKVNYKDLKPGDNEILHKVKIVLPVKEKDVEFAIDNIYYDYDKWDIRPDAAIELYKVVEFMKLNTDVAIELGSHTDARGSSTYNRNLAQKRAQSAVNFIVSKGIDKARINAKGYGEDKLLIADAKTEDEHQKNRRTTVRVTGIDKETMRLINEGEQKEKELLEQQNKLK